MRIGNRLCFIILQDLWTDATLCKMIYQAARNCTDPIDTIIFNVLKDSFVKYRGARSTQYWVFFLKPLSSATTTQEWNSLRSHVRKKMINNGNISITPALPKSSNLYCTICKLDTHPTFNCSYTRGNAVFQGLTKLIVGRQYNEQQNASS